MRILLDECIDWRLMRELGDHDVKSVRQTGWLGLRLSRLAPNLTLTLAFALLEEVKQWTRQRIIFYQSVFGGAKDGCEDKFQVILFDPTVLRQSKICLDHGDAFLRIASQVLSAKVQPRVKSYHPKSDTENRSRQQP